MSSPSLLRSLGFYRACVGQEITEAASEASLGQPYAPFPDIYIASSCLQKALRRGDTFYAWGAARYLLRYDEPRLWRRLAVCAFEDFGIVDLTVTARVVAACASPAFRLAQGRERVLEYLIALLCGLAKDRRLDDLYSLANASFGNGGRFKSLDGDVLGEAIATLVHEAARLVGICERAVPKRSFRTISLSSCERALEGMARRGLLPGGLLELCDKGVRASRCLLPLLLPLALEATRGVAEVGTVLQHRLPKVPLVRGVPAYAYDGFTRGGRAVLSKLALHEPRLAPLVEALAASARVDVLHHLLFFAEGGRVDRLLTDPLSRGLNIYAVALGARLPQPEADQAVELMERCLPTIHALRGAMPLPQPPEDLS